MSRPISKYEITDSVSALTAQVARFINQAGVLSELVFTLDGTNTTGNTTDLDAIGPIVVKQTGPGNRGCRGVINSTKHLRVMADAVKGLPTPINVSGGTLHASFFWPFYSHDDNSNGLPMESTQGLQIELPAVSTADTGTIWKVKAIYRNADCDYLTYISDERKTIGGHCHIDFDDNLAVLIMADATTTTPTEIMLFLSGERVFHGSYADLLEISNMENRFESATTEVYLAFNSGKFALGATGGSIKIEMIGGAGTMDITSVLRDYHTGELKAMAGQALRTAVGTARASLQRQEVTRSVVEAIAPVRLANPVQIEGSGNTQHARPLRRVNRSKKKRII